VHDNLGTSDRGAHLLLTDNSCSVCRGLFGPGLNLAQATSPEFSLESAKQGRCCDVFWKFYRQGIFEYCCSVAE
jgi:hypothetical protein